MAQKLKQSVRNSILTATESALIERGYAGMRLVDVAKSAGIATGNLYRYYSNKEALYKAVISRATAAELLLLLRKRVRELSVFKAWESAAPPRSTAAGELLDFWVNNRAAVIILLSGSEGSPLAHIKQTVISELTRLASSYSKRHRVKEGAPEIPDSVLVQIFSSTVDMIVTILREHSDASDIKRAFYAFWRYQLAGLSALLSANESNS